MNIEKLYKKEIDELLQRRGKTALHITGIRHCHYKDNADAFIKNAAETMLNVSFFPEKANPQDHEAVVCRYGKKKIGYVATYDLEKYNILAEKNDTAQLTGHFEHFSANVEDHILKLYMPGTITMDEMSEYRKKIDVQKDAIYGSWKHDAIDHYLVHSEQQEEAIACICQLKNRVLQLFGGCSTSLRTDLTPILDDYLECSQYDISLEGQQDRWDILLYLDLIQTKNTNQYFSYRMSLLKEQCKNEELYKDALKDEDDDFDKFNKDFSQIAGELVRSVSYKAYIERLTELVTKHLPLSEAAQHYLNALPPEALNNIRQQVESFPHHLYHLFHTNPEEFVRTIYYSRIPRRYLDPFLSGIALVEAYDKRPTKWQGPDERTMKLRNIGRLLEEWYEDYCERIVDYPSDRKLNALRVMRKQVLSSVEWAEGSPRFGDNPEDINYLIFSSPNKDYFPRLKDFGCNFGKYAQGEKKDMAWEDYIPEKYGHNMTLVEFAYMFFCSALNYEIDRLEDFMLYDKPYEDGTNDIKDNKPTVQQQSTDDKTSLPIPNALNTKRAQTYFQKAIEKGYMKVEKGKLLWIGVGSTGKISQLAYFCGLVYEYKNSINGNDGISFPEKELNALFGTTRLYSSLVQVYNAQKPQNWRTLIDELFE
ncbi:MAG: hypothetical protein K6D59_03120 [Bacteroidales bacterium]|nr:hypothetical protein [Bacteroidales bacterium]